MNTNTETNQETEFFVPLRFNEILYDASDLYSVGYLDFVDGAIQIEKISGTITSDIDVWNTPIARETLYEVNSDSIDELLSSEKIENTELKTYVLDSEKIIKTNLDSFFEYSIALDTVVYKMESCLKEALGDDYDKYISDIKEKSTTLSTSEFFNEEYLKMFGQLNTSSLAKLGNSIRNGGGMAAITSALNSESFFESIIKANHFEVLKGGFKAFATPVASNGANGFYYLNSSILGTSVLVGAGAAAISLYSDYANGDLDKQKVLVDLSRGGAATLSSLMTHSVIEYLATSGGASVGSAAVGNVAGIAVSLFLNYCIDKIEHSVNYAENGVPRKYEEINKETVKQEYEKQGIQTGTPKSEAFGNVTVYDAMNSLISKSNNEKLICFIMEKEDGISMISEEEYKKYDTIFRLWRNTNYFYNPNGKEALIESVKEFGVEKGSKDELEFIDDWYELFSEENVKSDPRLAKLWQSLSSNYDDTKAQNLQE